MATLKLGALLVKTLAKPVATSLKTQTKNSDLFKRFCIGVAQNSHKLEMKMKMNFLGYEKERIRPLSESRAVELGANFLGESLIFLVAASIIGFEAYRSNVKSKDRAIYVDDAIIDFRALNEEYQKERLKNSQILTELQDQVEQLVSLNEASTRLLQSVVLQLAQKTSVKDQSVLTNKDASLESLIEDIGHAKQVLSKFKHSPPIKEDQQDQETK